MGDVLKYRRRRRPDLWRQGTARKSGVSRSPTLLLLSIGVAIGAVSGLGLLNWPGLSSMTAQPSSVRFGRCHMGGGINCVVDGDTFWFNGERVRVADIDAPETHPPRCPAEADLGNRATERLHELLNAGPFTLQSGSSPDEDRYGRKLRIVERNGRSLGSQLVSEGLARPWMGSRQPWC
jgi:micrococcal nuclease